MVSPGGLTLEVLYLDWSSTGFFSSVEMQNTTGSSRMNIRRFDAESPRLRYYGLHTSVPVLSNHLDPATPHSAFLWRAKSTPGLVDPKVRSYPADSIFSVLERISMKEIDSETLSRAEIARKTLKQK